MVLAQSRPVLDVLTIPYYLWEFGQIAYEFLAPCP
jgi:hypothetical protein